MKYFSHFIFLFIVSVAVLSCKREGSSVTAPPDVSDTTTFQDSVDFTPKVGLNIIKGRVIDYTEETGIPVANVRVVLDSPLYGAMTDSNGWFYLPAPAGWHIVTCFKDGYATVDFSGIPVSEQNPNTPMRDTITLPPIWTARVCSYQPVNLRDVTTEGEAAYHYLMLQYDMKLRDERNQPAGGVELRAYKTPPDANTLPVYEVNMDYAYYGFTKDSNDKPVGHVQLNLDEIGRYARLHSGETCYVTIALGSGPINVGMYNYKARLFRNTTTGPESEAIKLVIP